MCSAERDSSAHQAKHGDGRIDQIAAKRPKPCEDAIFVRASKPGVADDVGYQDRGQFPGLAHGAAPLSRPFEAAPAMTTSGDSRKDPTGILFFGLGMARFHAALDEGVEAGSASLRVGSRSLSPPR